MNDAMTQAYIEAIYFTETGEDDQPSPDEPLHFEIKHEAWAACRRFRFACEGEIDLTQYDPAQLGHDLWLTRNGHGAGFWDRPEIYGAENARILTLMARAMGEHYAHFGE
jgi:hypothetical protein